jgi:hypothetical protein
MTKAIVAKLERFLDAAVAKLDPPSTHVMWVPPQPAGWTVEAARATGEELWACQGRAVREADLLTFVTWLPPPEERTPARVSAAAAVATAQFIGDPGTPLRVPHTVGLPHRRLTV